MLLEDDLRKIVTPIVIENALGHIVYNFSTFGGANFAINKQ